jgi:hypothetical protein
MTLTQPTDHGDSDVWGAELNANNSLIDAHDHTTGKGVPVPSNALSIVGDIAMATHAFTGLSVVAFTEIAAAAAAGYVGLFINSADHNLYFRNGSGVNVQITSGATINISLVGGIGGDYSSVNALLSYVDANLDYLFQQEGSPRPWAGIRTADIKLYQKAASIANYVRLLSPNALAAAYDVTFPAALPGSQLALQMTSAGGLTPSNAFTGAASFSGVVTALDVQFTSPHILLVPASAAGLDLFTSGGYSASTMKIILATDTTAGPTYPVVLDVPFTFSAWKLYIHKTTNAAATISAQLVKFDSTTNTKTNVGAAGTNSANAPGDAFISVTGLTEQATITHQYALLVTGSGVGGDFTYHAEFMFTRP